MADPDRTSMTDAVLEALGFALFVREAQNTLRLGTSPPLWLRELWPGLTSKGLVLPVAEASPFLENFLIDAEECWKNGGETRSRSGPWVEQTPSGDEVSLEATALTSKGLSVLLLERLGEVFEAKKALLQHARETVIAQQRLNSELQKKEILLSCIAEEMNSALANVVTALRLIEAEKHSARTQQLLVLAMRATENQQALINKIFNLFAAELAELYGRAGTSSPQASLGEILTRAQEMIASSFDEKKVKLRLEAASPELRVAIEPDHFLRVITSLLENGLHNSPTGGEVTVAVEGETDSIVIRVRDQGAQLPADLGENFFSTDKGPTAESADAQMRLQFCRVAVEKFQGELGCETSPSAGNCFWIRLPKVA